MRLRRLAFRLRLTLGFATVMIVLFGVGATAFWILAALLALLVWLQ